VDAEAIVAPARPGLPGWSEAELGGPSLEGMAAEVRAALAEGWSRDGLLEHASVASFGRFALELLAAGAPADLIEGAHRAALDEVRHARLCLGLASAYAGAPIGPGALPLGDRVEVTSDLASIAARAAREGCIGETIAAVQAEEQLARAADPAVRAVLAIIAADEARHAELSWRAVAWAVRTGGERVRAAVAAVLASVEGVVAAGARREGALDTHGRLDPEEQRRIAASAMAEVIRPAARLLTSASRAGTARHNEAQFYGLTSADEHQGHDGTDRRQGARENGRGGAPEGRGATQNGRGGPRRGRGAAREGERAS
jgi:hypothetical protein